MPADGRRGPRTRERLLWFVLLWCAGVAAMSAIALLVRLALGA